MKLVIRDEAVDDLDVIYDWIAKDNAAARVGWPAGAKDGNARTF